MCLRSDSWFVIVCGGEAITSFALFVLRKLLFLGSVCGGEVITLLVLCVVGN